ncbi:glycerol-3-phosphate dehydrogenase/oxidase [Pinibacter soli]|uniref:Glycerol-3-phosphate dehydrogenase/oxidase n=1 Tax=Pinibacter soli TaxID=3044211 RepID=A0ABT6RI78_9BACT|nr:glycerol-3-phosphate dehydrogenase/oxidase [Pinibacter soli]MDI3322255.1 glycerol-3-phosphate dehydrogenase/oxidase [Pinibacter soli]
MNRSLLLDQLKEEKTWDFIIVGGGATGLGAAVDAASRGYSAILFEQSDLAKGTSSRSTKLVHGGVRYMAQGDLALVREACYERGLLLKNAPHLSKNQTFVIPNYSFFDNILYTIGLKFYDMLAGKLSLGRSKFIGKKKTIEYLPTIRQQGLRGGVVYQDGQFDDARLAVNLAQTAIEQGACVLNYCRVVNLQKQNKKVCGVKVKDQETNIEYSVKGKAVINATGVFVDDLLLMDKPEARKLVKPSQGIHLVMDRSFLDSEHALMIPKTSDGRVLFAVPWHDKLVTGTTDTVRDHIELEPHALEQEINFILNTAANYLTRKPTRADVLSVFAGLRPLAAPQTEGKSTKEISRNHKIIVSKSNLVTITGGKWTTYRRMAQDVVDRAIAQVHLHYKPCVTKTLKIHGYRDGVNMHDHLYVYGSDIESVQELMNESPEFKEKISTKYDFTKAEVVWAVRKEFARNIDDVLARRCRLLFLDAHEAIKAAPVVAQVLARELGRDEAWIQQQMSEFTTMAKGYILN